MDLATISAAACNLLYSTNTEDMERYHNQETLNVSRAPKVIQSTCESRVPICFNSIMIYNPSVVDQLIASGHIRIFSFSGKSI